MGLSDSDIKTKCDTNFSNGNSLFRYNWKGWKFNSTELNEKKIQFYKNVREEFTIGKKLFSKKINSKKIPRDEISGEEFTMRRKFRHENSIDIIVV